MVRCNGVVMCVLLVLIIHMNKGKNQSKAINTANTRNRRVVHLGKFSTAIVIGCMCSNVDLTSPPHTYRYRMLQEVATSCHACFSFLTSGLTA